MSVTEVTSLDMDTIAYLTECIDILIAREALNSMKIADYPMMKPDGRRKLFTALKKQANPSIIKEEKRALTTEDLFRMINSG